ncbi:Retrovirus-related Pol poly from transposon TNT 1-94 [Paramuricea clavata]|uniref:Retrovirus-related Pol poly from transposon TNT 1-94 n=1 Tax=Paramuricea clavata TaxID=317549 RepID=A0A6S7GKR1_PARCT|nr:Retrovirus-related Pol poly from transposon TNT 1-94 [Paramuricea clavata]
MNRTIQETAQSMIHNAGLDMKFWAEAVCTAVIVRNHCPTVAVDNITPYECFNGKKPVMSNFKVFGCKAYMHVPKETRKKWDSKTKKCIFVGYSISSKGYRRYDPKTRTLHISRDVLFDEDEFIQQKKFMQIVNLNDSLPEDQEEPQVNKPSSEHVIPGDQDTVDHDEGTEEPSISRETERVQSKLNESIYGLKQSSRCWQNAIDQFLKNSGYVQSSLDPYLYIKQEGDDIMLIALYIDDLIPASNSKRMLHKEKEALRKHFKMKDLGEVYYCLGIQVERDRNKKRMRLHQSQYLMNLLKKFGMEECKPAATSVDQDTKLLPSGGVPVEKTKYQALIGGLTYAVTGTRPDLAQALRLVNQFCSNPGVEHWTAAKFDVDWGSNPNRRKSQSGYLFTLCGGVISWASKKQSVVALSSTEAKHLAALLACQEAVWLRVLLEDISFVQNKPTMIKEDNQGAIALSKNPKYHPRTKHIDISISIIHDKVCKERSCSRLLSYRRNVSRLVD